MFKAHRGLSSISAGIVAAGLLISTPTRTEAQGRFRYQRDYQRFEQRASDNGYREGFARGEEDARLRRDFSYARDDEYQRADVGFRVGDGDLRDYRRMFRQGFEAGYADGYDRSVRDGGVAVPRTPASRGPSGVTGGTLTPAARIGFQDGYDVGRKDATDGETFDPVRSGRYRSADHEYDRKYGSREEFKAEYRGGFKKGTSRDIDPSDSSEEIALHHVAELTAEDAENAEEIDFSASFASSAVRGRPRRVLERPTVSRS